MVACTRTLTTKWNYLIPGLYARVWETRTHIGLHSRELMKAMNTPGSCQEWGKVKVESRMFWIQFTNWLYTLLLSIIHRYPWLMDEDMLNSSEITSQEDCMASWFCKRRQHWKLNLCFKSVYKSCDKSIPRIPQELQGLTVIVVNASPSLRGLYRQYTQ
jgi:hypothetical protein